MPERGTIATASKAPARLAELAATRIECDLETGHAADARKAIEAAVPAERPLLGEHSHYFANYLLALSRARFADGDIAGALAPDQRARAVELARAALVDADHLAHTKAAIEKWLRDHAR